jgi:hypothetical protein
VREGGDIFGDSLDFDYQRSGHRFALGHVDEHGVVGEGGVGGGQLVVVDRYDGVVLWGVGETDHIGAVGGGVDHLAVHDEDMA